MKALFSPKWWPLTIAALAFLFANLMDIVSTLLCMQYLADAIEANPYMRDPATMKFLMGKAILVKWHLLLFQFTPLTIFLYVASKDARIAAIPLFLAAASLFQVASRNLLLLWV
jgi:hypothetical protein